VSDGASVGIILGFNVGLGIWFNVRFNVRFCFGFIFELSIGPTAVVVRLLAVEIVKVCLESAAANPNKQQSAADDIFGF